LLDADAAVGLEKEMVVLECEAFTFLFFARGSFLESSSLIKIPLAPVFLSLLEWKPDLIGIPCLCSHFDIAVGSTKQVQPS
jgi:hypothetical protein